MRSGIPSDLEGGPDLSSDKHVKNWGRWRSRAYKGYMKADLPEKRAIFGEICQALLA